jgi:hypothetical protein
MLSLIDVFIISSSEAIDMAEALQVNLEKYNVRIWDRMVFTPGDIASESLIKSVEMCDFAVVILSPDDELVYRGNKMMSPRDNVIFELGLCVAILGTKRTLYLFPNQPHIKIPTDINGINGIKYSIGQNRENLQHSLRSASTNVELVIKTLGRRQKKKVNVNDFKASVEIYYFDKVFTREDADNIAEQLREHDVVCEIREHLPTLSPDTIFIGACVPAYYARLVLSLVTYEVKYIYRTDYPEVEGGDKKGFKIGIGYSSAYNKDDTDIRNVAVPISASEFTILKEGNLSNTEFHKKIYDITMSQ